MSKKIKLTAKGDGETKNIYFQFSPELYLKGEPKSKSVFVTMFQENEELGIIELTWDDLNNFCFDLLNEHKQIITNQ